MSALAFARPDLLALAGYSSARDEAGLARVMLNANESPWPASDDAPLNRYPDPQPRALRDALAALYGVDAVNVLVGRGSDEAIDLATRAFCRAGVDEVIVSPPTFGMYAVCAAVQGARVVTVPLGPAPTFDWSIDAVRAAVTPATRIVFACTPNNPTGGTTPRDALLALADALREQALVIVDEAYVEFADTPSLATDVRSRPNLAVLRTLSKAHALAGARVGAMIAAPDVIALLRRIMAPYPLPAPSVAAALAALTPEALARTRARITLLRGERERVAAMLRRRAQVVDVYPSQANFLTVRLRDARAAYAALVARGVVVRDVGRYPGLADCLRFSLGTPAENDAVLDALRDVGVAA